MRHRHIIIIILALLCSVPALGQNMRLGALANPDVFWPSSVPSTEELKNRIWIAIQKQMAREKRRQELNKRQEQNRQIGQVETQHQIEETHYKAEQLDYEFTSSNYMYGGDDLSQIAVFSESRLNNSEVRSNNRVALLMEHNDSSADQNGEVYSNNESLPSSIHINSTLRNGDKVVGAASATPTRSSYQGWTLDLNAIPITQNSVYTSDDFRPIKIPERKNTEIKNYQEGEAWDLLLERCGTKQRDIIAYNLTKLNNGTIPEFTHYRKDGALVMESTDGNAIYAVSPNGDNIEYGIFKKHDEDEKKIRTSIEIDGNIYGMGGSAKIEKLDDIKELSSYYNTDDGKISLSKDEKNEISAEASAGGEESLFKITNTDHPGLNEFADKAFDESSPAKASVTGKIEYDDQDAITYGVIHVNDLGSIGGDATLKAGTKADVSAELGTNGVSMKADVSVLEAGAGGTGTVFVTHNNKYYILEARGEGSVGVGAKFEASNRKINNELIAQKSISKQVFRAIYASGKASAKIKVVGVNSFDIPSKKNPRTIYKNY